MNSDFGNKTFPHLDLLFTYALLITGESRKAEKILTQTVAKAFWFWKHLSEETEIKTWLIRIIINIVRSLPVDNNPGDDQIIENKTVNLSSIISLDLDNEIDYQKNKLLRQIISSLPLSLKEVIIFVDTLKFDIERTADLIELPENVIKRRLFDARKLILFRWSQRQANSSATENVQITLQDKLSIISLVDSKELEVINEERTNLIKQEIDAQNILKNAIAKNIFIQPVRQALKVKLANKYAPHLTNKINKAASTEKKGMVKIVTIAMIILITVLIILFRPEQDNPGEYGLDQVGKDNILVLLKNNYSMFLKGGYDSSMISADKIMTGNLLSVDGFHDNNNPPVLKGWEIKSLFLSSIKDVKLTNFIYENEVGRSMFLLQIPVRLVEEKKIINLTPELLAYLDQNNCYSYRNGATMYLLKNTESFIIGIALENPKKELIMEICNN